MNVLTLGMTLSVLGSIFFYWAAAKNRWMRGAFCTVIVNGCLLAWVNWAISGTDRIPVISGTEVTWTNDSSGANVFSILSVWMVIAGLRGLWRLKEEG